MASKGAFYFQARAGVEVQLHPLLQALEDSIAASAKPLPETESPQMMELRRRPEKNVDRASWFGLPPGQPRS